MVNKRRARKRKRRNIKEEQMKERHAERWTEPTRITRIREGVKICGRVRQEERQI